MLGDDRAFAAGDLRAAQDRAQVLGVHYRIEGDEQRRVGRKQFLQSPDAARLELGGNTLVDAWGDRVEAFGCHHLDSRQLGELFEARIVPEIGGLVDLQDSPGASCL